MRTETFVASLGLAVAMVLPTAAQQPQAPPAVPYDAPVTSPAPAPAAPAAQAACGVHCGAIVGCGTSGCGCDTSGCPLEEIFGDTPLLSGLGGTSCLSDDLTYSVGGELRYRYMDERNRLRPGVPVTGARTRYNLWRFTPYVSASYQDLVSAYVQGIDASAFGYDAPLTPVAIDVNRADLLRAYVELNLGDFGDGNLRYRYGRQFLKYGSQHVLSNLGWGNTFRNFEGHKLVYSSTDWNIDAFSMQSVNGAANGSGFDFESFDSPDDDRLTHGVYATYKGLSAGSADVYWIWSEEQNRQTNRQDGDRHTLGVRLFGTKAVTECCRTVGTWRWDLEGAYQFGEDDFTAVGPGGLDQDVHAGFISALFGYTFNAATWSPSINGIFYWGSGDSDPTDGEINTMYTLYPLGHAYWGLIDNFSGQNLLDYAVQTSVKPHQKLTLSATMHWFERATTGDAVYNVAGAPLAVGAAGQSIGNELDLLATVQVSKTLSVQAGYFWFWYGDAIENGAPRPDADQFYLMSSWQF